MHYVVLLPLLFMHILMCFLVLACTLFLHSAIMSPLSLSPPAPPQTANGLSLEASKERVRTNDRPNGELVLSCKNRAEVVVSSTLPLLGDSWKPKGKSGGR